MWMVEPSLLCRNHLLGEHRELHTFVGTLRKRISVSGYMTLGELDPSKIQERHEELVVEMKRRDYGHYSPIEVPDWSYVKEKACIDVEKNLENLRNRCYECEMLQDVAVCTNCKAHEPGNVFFPFLCLYETCQRFGDGHIPRVLVR